MQIVLSQTDSRHASDGDERLEILRVIFVTLGGCDCRICFLVHLWWCRHSLNLVQDHVAGASWKWSEEEEDGGTDGTIIPFVVVVLVAVNRDTRHIGSTWFRL